MEDMLRFSVLCIGACLLAAVVRQGSTTMGMLVALSAGLIFFGVVVERMQVLAVTITNLFSAAAMDTDIFTPVFKVLGICLCGRLVGGLCKDLGSQWAAGGMEVLTVLSAVLCMLPLLQELLRLVGSL